MTKDTGLIADIGATNARFALADANGIRDEKILKCVAHEHLAAAIKGYLSGVDAKPRRACIAIAGPVDGDVFRMTNHPWIFSLETTRKESDLDTLVLMNDFKALALAVPHFKPGDIRQIGGGKVVPKAPIGIIGPGTGLGVASLVWDSTRYQAVPGEGGHVTMPSRTPREFALFQTLLDMKYHHISAERVCSGKGLVNVYDALRRLDKRDDLPARSPEEISEAGLNGSCRVSTESLTLMLAFLGRVAGNLALTLGAQGGVYIAGGIAGKLGAFFDASPFRFEFKDKGRFVEYMEAIPTFVIEHPFPAFVGLRAELFDNK